MFDNNYSLYVHIFPNSKLYFGITKQNVCNRWGKNGSGYKKQPIYKAILEFGWNNILHYILKQNITKEEAIKLEKGLINNYFDMVYNVSKGGDCGSNGKLSFELNGKMYTSSEIADKSIDEINSHDITNRINLRGWDLQRAMTQPKQKRNTLYHYKDGNYTIQELYEIRVNKELTKKIIKSRLSKGWDTERAITQPDNIKLQPCGVGDKIYEYNGKMYNSYELYLNRKNKNISQSQIVNRINFCGWSVEDAITIPPTKTYNKYYYKNGYYSVAELADISPYNLISQTIRSRIKLGWDIEKAVNTPTNINMTIRSQACEQS